MQDTKKDGVGYGRPPKQTQFKPGQSGNPKGRPKGARSIPNLVGQKLDRKVQVTEDGKRKFLSKRQLAARQQVNKAAQGDPKAFQVVAMLEQQSNPVPKHVPDGLTALQSELGDEQSLEIVRQWLESLKPPAVDEDTSDEGGQP